MQHPPVPSRMRLVQGHLKPLRPVCWDTASYGQCSWSRTSRSRYHSFISNVLVAGCLLSHPEHSKQLASPESRLPGARERADGWTVFHSK